jgi:glycosyltransferase involved in cell wall biosynthesis
MMHLFINSLAASAGGGLTYIRNVLPQLAARRDVRVTVALTSGLRREFPAFGNITFLELQVPVARRFWQEQSALPKMIRGCGADVLLSTGNFALRNSPVPQVLLSRNSIYTSADFYRDLLLRREYRMWLETRLRAILAKKSIQWADVTVAPSHAFATELEQWAAARVITVRHGFDQTAFTRDLNPLAPDIEGKLSATDGCLKLLFVSHYNYYRNFETLIRALPLLRDYLADRSVKLLLTCQLAAGKNPGPYHPEVAASLVNRLGVSDMIVELGTVPYQTLHQLYARADIYITPAYTETFAHPLVEAMACGLPVVASDLEVHREICEGAAKYFPTFSPEGLAQTVMQVATSPVTGQHMAAVGAERVRQFSWERHVEEILALSFKLAGSEENNE